MLSLPSVLTFAHIVGFSLAIGAATAKVALLIKGKRDYCFVPTYNAVSKIVTRNIIVGQILVTVSGIGWLLYGYPLDARLYVKIALVLAVWVIGPFIDAVVEPRFRQLAPATSEPPSPAFLRIQNRHLAIEIAAGGIYYAIVVIWVLV